MVVKEALLTWDPVLEHFTIKVTNADGGGAILKFNKDELDAAMMGKTVDFTVAPTVTIRPTK